MGLTPAIVAVRPVRHARLRQRCRLDAMSSVPQTDEVTAYDDGLEHQERGEQADDTATEHECSLSEDPNKLEGDEHG